MENPSGPCGPYDFDHPDHPSNSAETPEASTRAELKLFTRTQVCQILAVSESELRAILENGLLAAPDCSDGLLWRQSCLLQFIWRRFYDSDFDAGVRLLLDIGGRPQ